MTPRQIGGASEWIEIAVGFEHTLGCKTNGTIYSWGRNNQGQLGLNNYGDSNNKSTPTPIGTDMDWVEIAAGENHSIGCKTNGSVYVWGNSWYGQLGLGDTVRRTTPTMIGLGE
jgi:alpha-tubulin suppressor-like RCC1 family protein